MTNKTGNWTEKMDDNLTEMAELQGPVLFYNETVMDHFTNPRNIGELAEDETDGFSLTGDSSCGDQMNLWIKVESGRIVDIKFKSFGCPGAISTSSMMTVLAKGKTIEEAKRLTDDDVIEALGGLPERKKHCSLLGVNALHGAIKDFEQRGKGERNDRTAKRPKNRRGADRKEV